MKSLTELAQTRESEAKELDARRDAGFNRFATAIGYTPKPLSESVHPSRVPSDEDRGEMMVGENFDGLS